MVLTPVSGHILVTPITESIDFVALQQRLRWAELRILQLEEQLRLARIAKYGPSSEKLNDAQLLLLEQEPGVSRCLKNELKPKPPANIPAARACPPCCRASSERSRPSRKTANAWPAGPKRR